jgi:hypothetical protein
MAEDYLPDWMRGITNAIYRTGARIGDEVRYTGDDGVDRGITITADKKYRIWERQAKEIGYDIGRDTTGEFDDDDDVSERVHEEADNHVPYGHYDRWMLFTEGQLYDMDEGEWSEAIGYQYRDESDRSRLPAVSLYNRAIQLIWDGYEEAA